MFGIDDVDVKQRDLAMKIFELNEDQDAYGVEIKDKCQFRTIC